MRMDYIQVARDTIKAHRLRQHRVRHRLQGLRGAGGLRQAVERHRAGRRSRSDDHLNTGAGDQGLMFGYACDETPVFMPAPLLRAPPGRAAGDAAQGRRLPCPCARREVAGHHALRGRQAAFDRHTVVLSTQQPRPERSPTKLKASFYEAVIEEIIKPVLRKEWLQNTRYLVNPTGRFVIGGPQGDCGLTGRKIIVDTYGGACPHGGGAFSGKDPSKVDRSAAYAARYVAKNVVAAGLAKQCQVQVAYAIGVAKPMNVTVYTEGTGVISDEKIAALVNEHLTCGRRALSRCSTCCARSTKDRRVRPLRPTTEFTWEATEFTCWERRRIRRAALRLRSSWS